MVRGGCFIDKESHGWLQVVFDGADEKDMESGGERNAVGGGRAGMTRGTKVEWECETDFLWRKNAVFLGWWGA